MARALFDNFQEISHPHYVYSCFSALVQLVSSREKLSVMAFMDE